MVAFAILDFSACREDALSPSPLVCKNDEWHVPRRPDRAAQQGRASERCDPRERRHEEAAPAQLLAGGGQQALKQSDDEESS